MKSLAQLQTERDEARLAWVKIDVALRKMDDTRDKIVAERKRAEAEWKQAEVEWIRAAAAEGRRRAGQGRGSARQGPAEGGGGGQAMTREIRRRAGKMVIGWLCVDEKRYAGNEPIAFFSGPARPFLEQGDESGVAFVEIGQWRLGGDCWQCTLWSYRKWRREYGDAPLPKRGTCERVHLEVEI